MLHKAWNSKGEMPYCFPRSSVKFQGHAVQNITDFDPNWAFPDYRPVAAFKSLRFALFQIPWQFPDLEKINFSLTFPWRVATLNWSYSPKTPNLGQIWQFLEPCDLEIWSMTLKHNRAPLLCYFKLCASFGSHLWIQTGVTVRKCPIWVKIDDLF